MVRLRGRNIPQVEVDGTNNVSLRGNGNVVVQINGRSPPPKGDQLGTFLAQMPANVVKTVEVAANPSASEYRTHRRARGRRRSRQLWVARQQRRHCHQDEALATVPGDRG